MKLNSLLLSLTVALTFSCLKAQSKFPYKVYQYDQRIDHFNQMTYGEKTFKQKILYQDKYWTGPEDPIFFYAGNEGPIEGFWDATGFVHEYGPAFKAFIIFPEHRFYGTSLPFGPTDSFKPPQLGLLTVDQAMADYAQILSELKSKILRCGKDNCKIIAFGGSYGGMLAAYMRFRYPNIIHGALAASSPILMQAIDGPHSFFFQRVTKDFQDIDVRCYMNVKNAFKEMDALAAKGSSGLSQLSSSFRLCSPGLKDAAAYSHLQGWVRNAFVMMAMLDYPYATDFMGSLPGNPVKVACDKILAAKSPIEGLVDAAGVFYNSSKVTCFDPVSEFIYCADPTGCGTGPAAAAWDFQACTDLILPEGSNNQSDMFPVLPWDPQLRTKYCQKTYGVTPRTEWPGVEFWGAKIQSSSNIIFSNGNLDPWTGGGIVQNVSDSIIAIPVEGGAHHLDLRASHPLDPPGVKIARQRELTIIKQWLAQGSKQGKHSHKAKSSDSYKKSSFGLLNLLKDATLQFVSEAESSLK